MKLVLTSKVEVNAKDYVSCLLSVQLTINYISCAMQWQRTHLTLAVHIVLAVLSKLHISCTYPSNPTHSAQMAWIWARSEICFSLPNDKVRNEAFDLWIQTQCIWMPIFCFAERQHSTALCMPKKEPQNCASVTRKRSRCFYQEQCKSILKCST